VTKVVSVFIAFSCAASSTTSKGFSQAGILNSYIFLALKLDNFFSPA
jgi:hypothetical protein